ncbi:MAG: response regulator [Symbiobacteriaceae bacterium]|nr:response regulator [Symbiobacteriaceae bacterium]
MTLRALSVDDNPINLAIIEEFARELGLEVNSFEDSTDAIEYCRLHQLDFDIVFLDYVMPKMNGIEFLLAFREICATTPVIMITADDDSAVRYNALNAGATDFLTKPLDPAEFLARTKNLLRIKEYQNLVANRAMLLEREVREATREIQEREYEALILLGRASEMRDTETGAHINRVSHFSRELARGIGLDPKFIDLIYYGSPLHDIGKVGIPDAILLKPGRLTESEMELMRTHTTLGFDILLNAKSKYMEIGRNIALTHHERWDGDGYPRMIVGEAIPIEGRITAVADVFDALSSRRPYKEPWSLYRIVEYMQEQRGKQFDPQLVDVFIAKANEFWVFMQENMDIPAVL